jgi:hypothetical protein
MDGARGFRDEPSFADTDTSLAGTDICAIVYGHGLPSATNQIC